MQITKILFTSKSMFVLDASGSINVFGKSNDIDSVRSAKMSRVVTGAITTAALSPDEQF